MRNFDMHGKGHGRGLGRHRMGKGIVIGTVLFVVLGLLVMSCGTRCSRPSRG